MYNHITMDIKELPSFDEQLQSYMEKHPDTFISILTPCYNSELTSHYCTAMIQLSSYFTAFKVPFIVRFLSDSLVTRGRNSLIAQAMNDEKTTHIMFIDADITFHHYDIVKLIHS